MKHISKSFIFADSVYQLVYCNIIINKLTKWTRAFVSSLLSQLLCIFWEIYVKTCNWYLCCSRKKISHCVRWEKKVFNGQFPLITALMGHGQQVSWLECLYAGRMPSLWRKLLGTVYNQRLFHCPWVCTDFCSDTLKFEEQAVRHASLWTLCCTQLRKGDGWLSEGGDAPLLGGFAGLSPVRFTLWKYPE